MILKTLAVIPQDSQAPASQKAPLPVRGVPLVVRVLRRVESVRPVDRIIVAADDERIAAAVRDAGGECMLTPPELRAEPTGGLVLRKNPSDIVLNVQVDDPLAGPDMIDPLAAGMDDPAVMLALCPKRIDREEEVFSPNIVKMVFDSAGRALYYQPLPHSLSEKRRPCLLQAYRPLLLEERFPAEILLWERRPWKKRKAWKCSGSRKRHSIAASHGEGQTIEIDTPEEREAWSDTWNSTRPSACSSLESGPPADSRRPASLNPKEISQRAALSPPPLHG